MFETCREKRRDKWQSAASKSLLNSHWANIKPQDTTHLACVCKGRALLLKGKTNLKTCVLIKQINHLNTIKQMDGTAVEAAEK